MEVYSLQHEKFCTGVFHSRGFLLAKCDLLGVVSLSSKFLNVYDFGLKMYSPQPVELTFSCKGSCDWPRSIGFQAKIAHVLEL